MSSILFSIILFGFLVIVLYNIGVTNKFHLYGDKILQGFVR